MPRKDSKPPEYKTFESLAQKLIQVPKAELDKKMKLYEEKKRKKQAKGRKSS